MQDEDFQMVVDEDFQMVVGLSLSYIWYLACGHIRCGDMECPSVLLVWNIHWRHG